MKGFYRFSGEIVKTIDGLWKRIKENDKKFKLISLFIFVTPFYVFGPATIIVELGYSLVAMIWILSCILLFTHK